MSNAIHFFEVVNNIDHCSLMKIWNLNKLSGVLGVFNCQGAGDWPLKQSSQEIQPVVLSGRVRPLDVEFLGEVAGENWSGECAIYAFHSGLYISCALKWLKCCS